MDVLLHEPLAPRTTLQVGGRADRYVVATTEEDVRHALREAPHAIVLGGGSNVLVADAGVTGTVLAPALRGIERTRDGDRVLVTAMAGEPWDDFVAGCVADGLAGLECLAGIPGWVGATPIQNVGAYGQEVAHTITRVSAIDRRTGAGRVFGCAECAFAYRDSLFKREHAGRFVVTSVTFALREAPPERPTYKELANALAALGREPSLADVRAVVIRLRAQKGMVLAASDPESRSAGSFFTNPIVAHVDLPRIVEKTGDPTMPTFDAGEGRVKLAAAWLIERAGFAKGHAKGRARISRKHALALVNDGGATAAEIEALAREIQAGVQARFGVTLEPEPVFLGFSSAR